MRHQLHQIEDQPGAVLGFHDRQALGISATQRNAALIEAAGGIRQVYGDPCRTLDGITLRFGRGTIELHGHLETFPRQRRKRYVFQRDRSGQAAP